MILKFTRTADLRRAYDGEPSGEKLSCEDCAWFTACMAVGGCIKAINEAKANEKA